MNEESNLEKKIIVCLRIIITIAILGVILNVGWYRMICTFTMIIPLHMIFFYSINKKLAKYANNSIRIMIIIMSCVTFLVPYILLPDAGDIGDPYAIFGLVKNPPEMLLNISVITFQINIIILIVELEGIKFKIGRNKVFNNLKILIVIIATVLCIIMFLNIIESILLELFI